jgi:cytochrome P450
VESYTTKNSKDTITDTELQESSGSLITGGSETSATLLSGAVYYLMRNPAWMQKLHGELQDSFPSDADIMFTSLSQLPILNAIIHETFRIYPTIPTAMPRVIPATGATVCGYALPPGTQLGIPQYSMNRSSRHFTNPEVYAPERFLGAEQYKDDKRHVIQPFSVGPRNCIGQNLAWAEIRAILARLVWNFEFELVDKGVQWEKQRVFILWQKPSLMVRLKERNAVA